MIRRLCHNCGALLRLRVLTGVLLCAAAGTSSLGPRCLWRHQVQELRPRHLSQHASRQRVRLGVVTDVNVQTVHHIEVRVGKEFLHRCIAHIRGHALAHERLKVRRGAQRLSVLQRGQWCIGLLLCKACLWHNRTGGA